MSWTKKSESLFELEPAKSSRFLLQVKAEAGKWYAFVGGEEVNEGATFGNLIEAKQAAQDAYDNYWSDFDDTLE